MMTLEAAGNSWPRSKRFVHNYVILNTNQLIDQSINLHLTVFTTDKPVALRFQIELEFENVGF